LLLPEHKHNAREPPVKLLGVLLTGMDSPQSPAKLAGVSSPTQ